MCNIKRTTLSTIVEIKKDCSACIVVQVFKISTIVEIKKDCSAVMLSQAKQLTVSTIVEIKKDCSANLNELANWHLQ